MSTTLDQHGFNILCLLTLPYQVWPSDYQSDLDNRCVWSRYEKEGCEQHEYSLWRHRFTDCSVDVTLRSDCLGCLNWPGRMGVLNSAHIRDIQESASSRQLDRWRWCLLGWHISVHRLCLAPCWRSIIKARYWPCNVWQVMLKKNSLTNYNLLKL